MPRYEHNKLVSRIGDLDRVPDDSVEYATWIKADGHLDLLRDNAKEDELMIHAVGEYTFVISAIVDKKRLNPLDQDDLLKWGGFLSTPLASYNWAGDRDDVWIERGDYFWDCKTLKGAQKLVFPREFIGLEGNDGAYYEILQEYLHLADIHWREEHQAYCRFDDNGDFDHIVSVTSKENKGDVTLISFKREPFELYLAATNSVLVRMFDFALLRRGQFTGWPKGPESECKGSTEIFYRQKVDAGKAAYTRGIQIVYPSRPNHEIFSSVKDGQKRKYVDFIADDLRNKCIKIISTDPTATTNYFETEDNSLPFELSPAFFRSDVLLKYISNTDKFTVSERTIRCRGSWTLKGYDINDAGQVHAYICDLRNLPYQEQLHWKSYNENPKAGISERAIANDFEGEITEPDSFESVIIILKRWVENGFLFWILRNQTLFERVGIPHTDSRDEWSESFKNLSKLIIEGFQIKVIRKNLDGENIAFDEEEKSISLLEKYLAARCKIDENQKLLGLRTVQNIRTTYSHSSSTKAKGLAKAALKEHGTYAGHFKNVCTIVVDELKLIEQAFS